MTISQNLRTNTEPNSLHSKGSGPLAFEMEELIDLTERTEKALNVLLLADEEYSTGCCTDHIRAIKNNSRHKVTVRNPRPRSKWDKFLVRSRILLKNESGEDYDVVIIHYSICILFESYVPRYLRKILGDFKGIKIQIIQDEYRWVNRMISEMIHLGVDAILSLVEKPNLDIVYGHPGLQRVLKVTTLAGYVSDEWVGLDSPPTKDRSKHLIYRGNDLPFWLGHGAYEKTTLTQKYLEKLEEEELSMDLSSDPSARIYGDEWLAFMKSGKAVIGLEGGASIFDFDERAEKSVKEYLKTYPDACYEEVHAELLSSIEGNVIYRTITPRSFEAIATRTVQVMYPGAYSGMLEPWKHYIPMKRDFSNANEVVGFLRDDAFLQKMATTS